MSSRRKKSIIQLYRTANHYFGNDSPNYDKQFGLRISRQNFSRSMDSSNKRNDYKKFCQKRSSVFMHKSIGKTFTRKRSTFINKVNECSDNEGMYKLFKVLQELSVYSQTKHDSSKLDKIQKIIRIKGMLYIFDYLLNIDKIKKSLHNDNLKGIVILTLLHKMFIDKTLKTSVKFNSRRYIKEYSPDR